ncbi:TRAP transporter substrate-binding protein [Salicibibacter kimchii]|uniref:C4-dicarboxylate ABC transporter substrate-binding protein n=1 Tax=Salicibibacter kimchii TaxID=2099786 RepID=A0A345BWG6_9BACI|nr:TRAP transporter substrate-binding protein [Salicibibacter kimchii]AXF55297.1 C4-dicarboxylate ABC transporter substrate-binding protein [Salicibibacter kimchii]
MVRKNILFMLILGFTLGILLVGCGENSTDVDGGDGEGAEAGGGDEEVVELSLGHVLTEDSKFHAAATAMAEEVEERSNGSMVVEIFPQGQLGDESQLISSARSGDTELVVSAITPITNVAEEFAIFDLPYLFDDFEHANQIVPEIIPGYFDILEDYELVGLGYVGGQEFNAFATQPIHEVSDLNGLKIRVPPAPGWIASYEELGAQATPTEYSEVYIGLEQGTLDGGVTSPEQFIQDNFNEVADYYSLTRSHMQHIVMTASQEAMDSLTDDQQEIIRESAEIATESAKDFYEEIYHESLEEAENTGTEIIEPDLEGFREQGEQVYDELIQDVPNGQELFDEIQEAR